MKRLSLDELIALKCPLHGEKCGTIVDISQIYVNGNAGGHIEVFYAYKLNAAFGVIDPISETRKRKG